MIEASEAEEAWWPPTFTSPFSRRWLALWIIQQACHSTCRSRSFRHSSCAGVKAASFMLVSLPVLK
jgi:hypothetical protein